MLYERLLSLELVFLQCIKDLYSSLAELRFDCAEAAASVGGQMHKLGEAWRVLDRAVLEHSIIPSISPLPN